jgi:Tol biopolymer transport system component
VSRPSPGQPARLVFETRIRDIGLRSIDLEAPRHRGLLQVRPLLDATRVDVPGAISPDGEKFAFRSYSGGWRLWVAVRDGEDVRQLTPVGAHMAEMGSWSPDGRRIVFDAAVDGNSDLYVVSESGGVPKRLTTEPSIELRPRWSQDGRWIYYSSNRTGRYEIWNMPADGGRAIQVTRGGGFEPFESIDGQSVYCLDQPPADGVISIGTAKLKRVPLGGNDEKVILEDVRANAWGVTRRGILFLSGEKDFDTIKVYSNGRVETVGTLPFRVNREGFGRVAFSPDGRWALTNQDDRSDSDLMLVENFR